MEVQSLLFWVVVGVLVGALLLLIGHQIILNLLRVEVTVTPG